MKEAVVIQTILEAEACLRNDFCKRRLMLITHPSVKDYLVIKGQLNFIDLASLFSPSQMIAMQKEVGAFSQEVISELDQMISQPICSAFHLDISFFEQGYSYYGKRCLNGIFFFKRAIEIIRAKYSLIRVYIFEYANRYFGSLGLNIIKACRQLYPDIDWQELPRCQPSLFQIKREELSQKSRRWLFTVSHLNFLNEKMRHKIFFQNHRKKIRFNMSRKNIFFLQPLYELDFLMDLKDWSDNYNFVVYDSGSGALKGIALSSLNVKSFDENEIAKVLSYTIFDQNANTLNAVYGRMLMENFCENIFRAVSLINSLSKLKFEFAAWGNPCPHCTDAWLFAFLRSVGVKTIGMQHGGTYGDRFHTWHMESDYSKCDIYFSFGYTSEDLAKINQSEACQAQIMPVGKVKTECAPLKSKTRADLVFPLNLVSQFFDSGVYDQNNTVLYEEQKWIIQFLDHYQGKKIYLKPFMSKWMLDHSVLPIPLNSLKNVKVVDYLTLTEFMRCFSPRGIIFELASTGFYESLPWDVEVFCLDYPIHPFEPGALKLLEKRAYIARSVEELCEYLKSFMSGELPPRRDNSYVDHYWRTVGAKERIVDFINTELLS